MGNGPDLTPCNSVCVRYVFILFCQYSIFLSFFFFPPLSCLVLGLLLFPSALQMGKERRFSTKTLFFFFTLAQSFENVVSVDRSFQKLSFLLYVCVYIS